jgi:hypothetical protein
MMIRRSGVLAALLAVLFAAGCAGASTDDPAVSAPSASATPSAPAPPSSQPPSAEPGSTTLSGTITAGVEGNCLLLKDDSGSHLLVFKDPALRAQARAGMKVTVVGTPQPRMMSTCQQGIPFVVSTLTR